MTKFHFQFLFMFVSQVVFGQKIDSIQLYPNGVPGAILSKNPETSTNNDGILCLRDIQTPMIYAYTPKNKTSDAAVVIYPGGGYYIVAIDHEGFQLAKWFNERGITAFVVKYRVPMDEYMTNKEIRPLQDAQQAIRYVRQNSAKFGINIDKIGTMGFSAGGHLAATVSSHFQTQVGEIIDDKTSVKPNFQMLIYPVISFGDKFGHLGSRDNLLGLNPPIDKIDYYCNEKWVTKETPPTFLLSTSDDFVSSQNSIEYYMACKKNNVPAELHIFESGGHGYALIKKNRGPVEGWSERLEDWLRFRKLMK